MTIGTTASTIQKPAGRYRIPRKPTAVTVLEMIFADYDEVVAGLLESKDIKTKRKSIFLRMAQR